MPGKIALAVSVQVQAPHATPATHRILPDSGVHSSALPLDVARESHVDR